MTNLSKELCEICGIKNALKKVYEGQAPETVQQAFFEVQDYKEPYMEHWRL